MRTITEKQVKGKTPEMSIARETNFSRFFIASISIHEGRYPCLVQATMSQTVPPQLKQSRRAKQETEPHSVDPDELLSLFGDEYTRAVLEVISETPLSGSDIVDETGFSKATVYRRLDRLESAGLVESETMFDPDGHHRERFQITFDGATCRFGPEGLEMTVHSNGSR